MGARHTPRTHHSCRASTIGRLTPSRRYSASSTSIAKAPSQAVRMAAWCGVADQGIGVANSHDRLFSPGRGAKEVAHGTHIPRLNFGTSAGRLAIRAPAIWKELGTGHPTDAVPMPEIHHYMGIFLLCLLPLIALGPAPAKVNSADRRWQRRPQMRRPDRERAPGIQEFS